MQINQLLGFSEYLLGPELNELVFNAPICSEMDLFILSEFKFPLYKLFLLYEDLVLKGIMRANVFKLSFTTYVYQVCGWKM